jgi:DNA repair protein RadC
MAMARLGSLEDEEFWVALVDNKNRLVGWEQVSRGTVDQTAVYPGRCWPWRFCARPAA